MKAGRLVRLTATTCAAACGLAGPLAHATEVTGLNTFTPGTPAKASEVNGNFTAVKTAVDDNHARITALESGSGPVQSALADHESRITTLESTDVLGPLMYGDGSAGDLVISANTVWTDANGPTNLNFNNITIQSGATLTVPGGTTIRCAGSFTNNGNLVVNGAARGGMLSNEAVGVTQTSTTSPHPGDNPNAPALPALDNDGSYLMILGGAGGAAMLPTYVMSNLARLQFGASAGSGSMGTEGGTGGGLLRVLCNNGVTNAGSISADGGSGGGGGGGGIVVLASRASVSNSGAITARGGSGVTANGITGAGGGGGGGYIVLIAPALGNSGAANVSGGLAGSSPVGLIVTNPTYRSGGGGGGGSGGAGGRGGRVIAEVADYALPGGTGVVISLQKDPMFLVR